jgi:hypothetical protein
MTATLTRLDWTGVRDGADRRRVVYYRASRDGRAVGAVARQLGRATTDDWRATGYSRAPGVHPPQGIVALGRYPTRRRAERAVEIYAAKAALRLRTCFVAAGQPFAACGRRGAPFETTDWMRVDCVACLRDRETRAAAALRLRGYDASGPRVAVRYTNLDGDAREWIFRQADRETTYAVDPPVTFCPYPDERAAHAAASFRERGFTDVTVVTRCQMCLDDVAPGDMLDAVGCKRCAETERGERTR